MASARRVRVTATLPVQRATDRLPRGARYDKDTRRLQLSSTGSNPARSRGPRFPVRMGGVGFYAIAAEARGENDLQGRTTASEPTSSACPMFDLVVSERLRVVDVGGRTTSRSFLRNTGTTDATNLKLTAILSRNLKAVKTGIPDGPVSKVSFDPANDGNEIVFVDAKGKGIRKNRAAAQLELGIIVEVTGAEPLEATCKVSVTHDDGTDPFDDMARIKVMPSRNSRAGGP